MASVTDLLRHYFTSKTKQLLAACQECVAEHSSLRGTHREEVIRIFLTDIVPQRYEIGKGMVYGPFQRSHEADIVIWDAQNYPSLRMLGHSMFFAESVRVVLEVKSRWSFDNFEDIQGKCQAVRDIIAPREPTIEDMLEMLQLEVASLRSGQEHSGILIKPHHIATGAIVLYGGDLRITELPAQVIDSADDRWPDALLFLERGLVVFKHYQEIDDSPMGGHGYLEFLNAGEDALALYTSALLALIIDRSVNVENPLNLDLYMSFLRERVGGHTVAFPLTRPVPGRVPLW